MAVALSGCVIIKQDGTRVVYLRKCDYCGHVVPGECGISFVGTITTGFQCPKCRKKVTVKIKG